MPKEGLFIKDASIFYELEEDSFSSKSILEELFDETVSVSYLTSRFGNEVLLPIEIFAGKLAPLQAIVKYSKENMSLTNSQIAQFTGRNDATIWLTYNKVNKVKWTVNEQSKLRIPLGIFKDDKLSVLEILVSFLKSKGMDNCNIARLLKKDPRTIWTVLNRANKKNAVKNDKE